MEKPIKPNKDTLKAIKAKPESKVYKSASELFNDVLSQEKKPSK